MDSRASGFGKPNSGAGVIQCFFMPMYKIRWVEAFSWCRAPFTLRQMLRWYALQVYSPWWSTPPCQSVQITIRRWFSGDLFFTFCAGRSPFSLHPSSTPVFLYSCVYSLRVVVISFASVCWDLVEVRVAIVSPPSIKLSLIKTVVSMWKIRLHVDNQDTNQCHNATLSSVCLKATVCPLLQLFSTQLECDFVYETHIFFLNSGLHKID